MNKHDARLMGYIRGRSAARNVDFDPRFDEDLYTAAHEAEQNSRQYADFVDIANAINGSPEDRVEGLWSSYDEGVTAGINKIVEAK
jgi:hypothetical protein